ncbi:EpsI domain-containing exosortase [Marinobacter vulgaris]|uniref:EpsI domain-containing exosortase n=1 Tax=Marinobacter vulgaris TaxID=1928331 RepID=A0A2V3ZJI2_9GAMM|nr:exosortase [Marinobacter vulgaris]PXX90709.1 EpsI domain-containing exosortase [Marinobacter vulgaris]TSJ70319.1 exosortase/archaeosortase family protein [Marinobacter vulgaris]
MGETKLRSGRIGWDWFPFVIVFASLIFLLWPTLEGIFSRWLKFDESYSHGFLLLLVSVVLVFRVVRLRTPVPGFYPFWLVPFMLALLAYGLGDLLRVQALQHLMVVPLILGALAVLLGWKQVRWFIAPVGLVFFAMPVWDFLAWTLQLITVEINQLLLGLFNIEFEVEGVFVYLIGVGTFEIAHGCSGLRYLLVGQSLSLIYGELNLRTLRARVILFATSVFLALFANWVRVFVIIYMGYETDMQTGLIEDHDSFGWWVFAATLVPLFLIGRRLENSKGERATDAEGGVNESEAHSGGSSARLKVGIAITALLPLMVWFVLPSSDGAVKSEPMALNIELDGERFAPLFSKNLEGWRPRVRNPDRVYVQTLFDRSLATDQSGFDESLFAAVYSYDYQRESAELIQYSNRVYDREEWHPEAFFTLSGPDGAPMKGITLRHRITGDVIHLAYTYYVEGFWETDDLRAKLAQVRGFVNARSDASLIVFGVSCDDCNGKDRLSEVVHSMMEDVVASVDKQVLQKKRGES